MICFDLTGMFKGHLIFNSTSFFFFQCLLIYQSIHPRDKTFHYFFDIHCLAVRQNLVNLNSFFDFLESLIISCNLLANQFYGQGFPLLYSHSFPGCASEFFVNLNCYFVFLESLLNFSNFLAKKLTLLTRISITFRYSLTGSASEFWVNLKSWIASCRIS